MAHFNYHFGVLLRNFFRSVSLVQLEDFLTRDACDADMADAAGESDVPPGAKWITLKKEGAEGKGRRILIGSKGQILGGDLPASTHGKTLAAAMEGLEGEERETREPEGGALRKAFDNAYAQGYEVLTHNGNEPDISPKKREGAFDKFDGIFASRGESSEYGNGKHETSFAVRPDKIAREGDVDINYEKAIKFLKREYPELDDKEIDRLYDLTAGDESIYDDPENNPLKEIGYDDPADASWEFQNIRGKIAVNQGFDAIATRDELGASYFIPYGSKAKNVKSFLAPSPNRTSKGSKDQYAFHQFDPRKVASGEVSPWHKYDLNGVMGNNLSRPGPPEEATTKDSQPTPAQKEAGNYPKGHLRYQGLDISIENPKGSTRYGKGWKTRMPAHYGYIRGYGISGADGDHPDIYLANVPPNRMGTYTVDPNSASDTAYIVDQRDPVTGAFDEHKIILGTDDMAEAMNIYNRGFSDGSGPRRMMSICELPINGLKHWLRDGDTGKPFHKQYHQFYVAAPGEKVFDGYNEYSMFHGTQQVPQRLHLVEDDHWITLKNKEGEEGEEGRSKGARRVLLSGTGKVKGGDLPASTHGKKLGKAMAELEKEDKQKEKEDKPPVTKEQKYQDALLDLAEYLHPGATPDAEDNKDFQSFIENWFEGIIEMFTGKGEIPSAVKLEDEYGLDPDAAKDFMVAYANSPYLAVKKEVPSFEELAEKGKTPHFESPPINENSAAFFTQAEAEQLDKIAKGLAAEINNQSSSGNKRSVQKAIGDRLRDNKEFQSFIKNYQKHISSLGNWGGDETDRAVATIIQAWAGTSADTNSVSLGMQLAAAEEFHELMPSQPTTAHLHKGSLESANKDFLDKVGRAGAKAFLRAQYDATQAYFKERGITGLYLVRGVKGANAGGKLKPGTGVPVHLQPMSSFSIEVSTAASFAGGGEYSRIMGTYVPVENIMSSPLTGYGCSNEYEYVVLGGEYSMDCIRGSQSHYNKGNEGAQFMKNELAKLTKSKSSKASEDKMVKGLMSKFGMSKESADNFLIDWGTYYMNHGVEETVNVLNQCGFNKKEIDALVDFWSENA